MPPPFPFAALRASSTRMEHKFGRDELTSAGNESDSREASRACPPYNQAAGGWAGAQPRRRDVYACVHPAAQAARRRELETSHGCLMGHPRTQRTLTTLEGR